MIYVIISVATNVTLLVISNTSCDLVNKLVACLEKVDEAVGNHREYLNSANSGMVLKHVIAVAVFWLVRFATVTVLEDIDQLKISCKSFVFIIWLNALVAEQFVIILIVEVNRKFRKINKYLFHCPVDTRYHRNYSGPRARDRRERSRG